MIMNSDEYHVFLSYAGDDREAARSLEKALLRTKVHGKPMRVFRDERSIDHHESITKKVNESVLRSTVLLAYYSRAYSSRPACQLELNFAFLLAQRSGTVERRILVVNPEGGTDHIEPVELRDLKYQRRPVTDADHRQFAEQVAKMVGSLPGPLGAASAVSPPRWWPGDPLPDRGVIQRFAERWQLHSALRAGDFGLVEQGPALGVAVISGLPGAGKTTLAEQYAWDFAPAFPGGVHWFGISGDRGESDALLDYRRMLREMATSRGVSLAGTEDDRLHIRIAEHFTQQAEPVLWVIDQVPAGMPDEAVRGLLVPSRYVHTILTCRENRYNTLGVPVHLHGLTESEGLTLLEGSYGSGERAEARALVRDLGGHPHDLRVAGAKLKDNLGLLSLTDYREKVAGEVDSVLKETLRELNDSALSVLGLASFLAPVPVPRHILRRAAELLHGWTKAEAQDRLLPTLESLTRGCLLSAAGEAVALHPRVRRALPGETPPGYLAAVGQAVAERLARETVGPDVVASPVVTHARHLVDIERLPNDAAISLLRLLIAIDERTSSHLSAAKLAERLVARLRHRYGDDDPRTREMTARAASMLVTVADYPAAVELAELALRDSPTARSRSQALHALAAALDGQGRFDDAEPYWQQLESSELPAGDADRVRVDRTRALRRRGRSEEAATMLAQVSPSGPPQRHVEEALLQELNGRPRLSRAAAERALAEFEEAGLARHPLAFEAAVTLVDAKLAAFAHVPYPFGKVDREQLAEMKKLCAEYQQALGPANPLTLSARVSYGISVAGWQDGAAGRAILQAAEEDARSVLDERHPIRLRIRYGLSCAALRLKEFGVAEELADSAYREQRLLHGERHLAPLLSLLQLGIAGTCARGDAASRQKIVQARRELGKVLGPTHDQLLRGYVAEALSALPWPVFKGILQLTDTVETVAGRASHMVRSVFGRT